VSIRSVIFLLLAAVGSAIAVEPPTPVPERLAEVARLELVTRDARQPVTVVYAPGDPTQRLFVVERKGTVRVLRGGTLAADAFLDVSDRIATGHPEQGLLGVAFHPGFRDTGRFFVDYTDRKGDTRIVEMRLDPRNPDRADPASAREILFIDQPYANHNGGNLVFGPDGKLWVGTGDGGSAGDPQGNAQNRASLLGKMLRIDVDAEKPAPEVVGIGLRNPWRYAFDRKTGDLYIADVGQDRWEWVTVVPAGHLTGHNFGWNVVEGSHCYGSARCDTTGFTLPAVEYGHDAGCSIIGGDVYRGKALPELDGLYFYSDFCTALLRSFRWQNGRVEDRWDWKRALDPESRLAKIASFGLDGDGEFYLVSQDGAIWKLVHR
jgi:glucose/arabinose dehydrogenase